MYCDPCLPLMWSLYEAYMEVHGVVLLVIVSGITPRTLTWNTEITYEPPSSLDIFYFDAFEWDASTLGPWLWLSLQAGIRTSCFSRATSMVRTSISFQRALLFSRIRGGELVDIHLETYPAAYHLRVQIFPSSGKAPTRRAGTATRWAPR